MSDHVITFVSLNSHTQTEHNQLRYSSLLEGSELANIFFSKDFGFQNMAPCRYGSAWHIGLLSFRLRAAATSSGTEPTKGAVKASHNAELRDL